MKHAIQRLGWKLMGTPQHPDMTGWRYCVYLLGARLFNHCESPQLAFRRTCRYARVRQGQ